MRIGYRAGFLDGRKTGRRDGFKRGREKGFEEGYAEALADQREHEARLVATGGRLAAQNILDRLRSDERGETPFLQWVARVMQEIEEALR